LLHQHLLSADKTVWRSGQQYECTPTCKLQALNSAVLGTDLPYVTLIQGNNVRTFKANRNIWKQE